MITPTIFYKQDCNHQDVYVCDIGYIVVETLLQNGAIHRDPEPYNVDDLGLDGFRSFHLFFYLTVSIVTKPELK